jgi:hypothetical protein
MYKLAVVIYQILTWLRYELVPDPSVMLRSSEVSAEAPGWPVSPPESIVIKPF